MRGAKVPANYGPSPWQQTSWDARAAGNFIGGGMGGGLVVFAALSGAIPPVLSALMVAGLVSIGAGLLCVALELGQPRRAFRVLRNPRTSWMAREAWTAVLLFPIGLGAALGVAAMAWIAAALALAFVYCQARLLQGAKGIPAWHQPWLSPLLVTTGLAEGGGVFLMTAPLHGAATTATVTLFITLVIARFATWIGYRRRLADGVALEVRVALNAAGRVLLIAGTVSPLVLMAVAAFGGASAMATASATLAGLLAAIAGARTKLVIVTRAGYTQGYALAHLPVRGTRADPLG
ncbi:MAG TPA: DmsC/YnfH family molybdoenzyme membrane anchor subunit [Acidimicrobiia bacterium]|nr:DmsC/YnfH family molybdoenzyme membrane anchor subunit [Acidimicrobiia bacterium]